MTQLDFINGNMTNKSFDVQTEIRIRYEKNNNI